MALERVSVMEFLKTLGLVLTYCAYSSATLTGHLNSDFKLGSQVNSQSSRPAKRLVGLSSFPGSSEGLGQKESHKTYDFNYKVSDGQGNSHYHKQGADGKGTVTGTYGYTDVHGLHRVVDYIADAKGFRAKIQTNEPGAEGRRNPANIEMIAAADVKGGEAAPLGSEPIEEDEGGIYSWILEEDDEDDELLEEPHFPHSLSAVVNEAFKYYDIPASDGKDKENDK